MTYYPIPDIPDGVTPAERRFCEQVRTAIQKVDAYGQQIEVHQPFFTDSTYAVMPTLPLVEFPVYCADRDVELLYANWTVSFSLPVEHNLIIRWRAIDGTTPVILQNITAASATTTDWVAYTPKRFAEVTGGRRILKGQILTLEIESAGDPPTMQTPVGLLSMYLRGATS